MILKEVIVNREVQFVWEALTRVEKIKDWYFTFHDFELIEGNRFYFYEPGDRKQFKHECVIKRFIPLQLFQHSWTFPEISSGESVLTWKLHSLGNRTKVTLIHEGIESFSDGGTALNLANFEAGWEEIVKYNLVNYLSK